jgi:oligoendopeptidase F
MNTNELWDLDSIFPGGSESAELQTFLQALEAELATAETLPLPAPLTAASHAEWTAAIERIYDLGTRLQHAGSFVNCLASQNVKDMAALQLMGRLDPQGAKLGVMWTHLGAHMAAQDEAEWEALLATAALAPIQFHLNEQRDHARQLMSPEKEALAGELATNGYHAWGRLYTILSGNKEVEFEGETLSLGQLQSKFMDTPDRATRERAFDQFEKSWGELAQTAALALNYQAGFRLTLYKHRGWESVLQEPLKNNRLTAETLDTMWGVVDQHAGKLLDYFAAKAKLFGTDQLSWFDVFAPVSSGDAAPRQFTYAEAAEFVVENIGKVNPEIAEFCQLAVDKRWVEAENRSGKRAGAYCTSLPLAKEPRIFMTYNGSFNGMLTLAHELGHGYHGWVMRDLPAGARRYTMSVAETASTLNELIVKDAAIRTAASKSEKLGILAAKLNDATSFMMNIRARFEFEKSFFSARAKGALSADQLSELMVSAQKLAYKDGLARYEPLFWASKLHFYITQAPFYNFPYSFGYLFSNGVYAHATAEGADFVGRYRALLQDTGSMTTEELAHKYLGVDLTQPEFWETAVTRILADVDEFVALSAES